MSIAEVQALAAEYLAPSAQRPPELTSKFMEVVREEAARSPPEAAEAGAASTSAGAADGGPQAGAPGPLAAAYQSLYAAAIVCTLRRALEGTEDEAAAHLRGVDGPEAPLDVAAVDGGVARFAQAGGHANGAAEAMRAVVLDSDDDGDGFAPLQSPASAAAGPANGAAAAARAPPSWEADVAPKVLQLSRRLGYHAVGAAFAWRELQLVDALVHLVRLSWARPSTRPAAEALCALLHDRMVSAPADVDRLPAVLDALGVSPHAALDADGAAAAALGLGTAASLAGQLATVSARRRLWQEAHDVLLPAGARLLEWREAQRARRARRAGGGGGAPAAARQRAEEEEGEAQAAMVVCQLSCHYVLHAPPSAAAPAKLQEALLRGGLFRSLVLLLRDAGAAPAAEPLRRAMLTACAAAPGLAAWAAAVPGFNAAWEEPAFLAGGACELHGAAWAALAEAEAAPGGGDARLAAALAAQQPLDADRLPGLYASLLLLADLQQASGRGARAPWGPAAGAALSSLALALRSLSFAEEEAEGGAGAAAGDPEAEAAADARKLAQTPAQQAPRLAARRARRLQPECLRLAKALAQRPGAAGKAD